MIFGPFSGPRDTAGDRVNLLKPDPPQSAPSPTPGLVPYILADQVTYAIAAPWPTNANGTGLSLQRIDSAGYGDDPINWRAAAPTAGAANPGSGSSDIDGDGLPDVWEIANGLD